MSERIQRIKNKNTKKFKGKELYIYASTMFKIICERKYYCHD